MLVQIMKNASLNSKSIVNSVGNANDSDGINTRIILGIILR
jgi:hypothetical protein